MTRESAMRTVDRYDIRSGWSKVPEPFPEVDCNADDMRALGYHLFQAFGGECDRVEAWLHKEEGKDVAIFVDGVDGTVQTFLAADLPSTIDLLAKLAQPVIASNLDQLWDIAFDLQDLSANYGGPLEDARRARHRAFKTKRSA
jgi:hypothetical protein